jgi:glutathione reductase (NADPH)
MTTELDLVVIGGGSGGVRTARIAATHGARVVLIEKAKVGGTCVHAGCVPKKLLVYAAQHARALRHATRYGFPPASAAPHAWAALLRAVRAETDRLGTIYERNLKQAGVELMHGTARVAGAGAVEVDGRTLRCKHILIATGSHPFVPEIPGKQHALTSDDVFVFPERPSQIVIVGGGYIALELSCMLRGLGAEVTIVQRGPRLMSELDEDLSEHIALELRQQGITVMLETQAVGLDDLGSGRRVLLDTGGVLECDAALFATGRMPNSAQLGLESAGVLLGDRGKILVDAYSATNVPGIHAVGDVTGRLQLTPVAIAEGHALADTLFGGTRRSAHEYLVPTAVFTEPELAMVGETERAARARGATLDIYRSNFRPLEHALDGSPSRSLMKLVVDRPTQRVLGCHLAAPHASEVVQGIAAAMTAGVTKQQLDATIGIHPTIGEELLTMRRPVADA